MLPFVVNLHGDECAGGKTAAGDVTVECRLTVVAIKVSTQVNHIFTPSNTKASVGVLGKQ